MKKKQVYILEVNGPGTLGGPMGTEHEGATEFRRVCLTVDAAKKAAQRYFDKRCDKEGVGRQPIKWRGRDSDMLWLLFHIDREKVA